MMRLRLDWSPTGWTRVIVATVFGTLACVIIAVLVDLPTLTSATGDKLTRAILQNTLLPLVLAAPAFYVLTNKIRQLAIAHEQMTLLATTDSLTRVLNRGAFTMLVEAYLKKVEREGRAGKGALLIIDADHFKEVNDGYGHSQGDVALRLIAERIQGMLRGADLVGRVGGEEFAVFLPDSDARQAETVAERIRSAVNTAEFTPAGARRELSVSVGGAVFARPIAFDELYRIADRHLYKAKESGRNRVSLAATDAFAAAA